MSKKSELLNAFGAFLMTHVRDVSIRQTDLELSDGINRRSQTMEEILLNLTDQERQKLALLIPYVVDTTLAHFLGAIEESTVYRLGVASDDTFHDLTEISDGLAGELYGDNGWFARFSHQRQSD